jgi:hypothetical protein
MGARARKVGRTTVGLDQETKALLDELRPEGMSNRDFLYQLARQAAAEDGRELPARPARPRGEFEFEIGFDDLPVKLIERIERIEGMGARIEQIEQTVAQTVAQLKALNVAALLPDPQTGATFDVTRAPSGTSSREIAEPDDQGFALRDEGFFGSSAPESGPWVQAPSGAYLTDRDDTLPDAMVAMIRAKAKAASKGRKRSSEDNDD